VIARLWHGCIVAMLLAAFVVQVLLAVHASASPAGHGVGVLAGAPLGTRLLRVVSFFTIESNVLCAVVSAQLARDPDRDGPVWRVIRLDALFGIAVTGIVYSTVLAKGHEPKGWEQVSTNTVFHYLVPIMMVLGWLLFGPRPRITVSVVLWSLVWPLLWFGYTLAHGAASRWYPYPFVDVATQGYGRVLVNAVLVTVVFGAVSALFALGDRTLPHTPPARSDASA
jgi:uncharacterized membrane protein